MKSHIADKVVKGENIVLLENHEIMNESNKIAEDFKRFFSNAVNLLGIDRIDVKNVGCSSDFSDPILESITKYKEYPSIVKIKRVFEPKFINSLFYIRITRT